VRETTTRWLVRFGYDGTVFYGWARQPGISTVEGTIRHGLARHSRKTVSDLFVEVASRTDRGVSARANALALESALGGPALLRSLNGISPDLFFTAAAEIPFDFRVRGATRRVYRYYDAREIADRTRTERAAGLFTGEIDVRSLGRGLPISLPVRRSVESVSLRPIPGGTEIEVRAPSFVWGMVRKIVAALREVDEGRLSISRLRAALEGTVRLPLPLAEPEPLVLWDVEYPIPWTLRWDGPNRAQDNSRRRRIALRWAGERVRHALEE
jgi:tRNA pseudouridine38-40 synthase